MFPSLPTDNLYKFIFVGCIFLIGLVVYDRNKKNDLLWETYNNLILDKTKNDSEYNIIKIDLDRFSKDLDYWNEQKDNLPKHQRDSLRIKLDNYYKLTENFKQSTLMLSENLKHIIKKIEEFENNKKYWNTIIFILIIGAIFSGYSWYHKVQKLQDSILSDEAILKKIQVKKNETSE